MINSKSYFSLLATVFSASFVLLSGCSSSGGGSTTPTLPADAVTITSTNAEAIANSAVGTLSTLGSITGADAQTLPSVADAIHTVTDMVFNRDRRSMAVATGITETYYCTSGSFTVSYNETDTSESGSVTFNNCQESGVTFNGSFSYSSSWSNTTYDYTDSGSGSLTISYGSDSFTLVMTYDETGNEGSGDYSTSLSYSVSGIPGGGFLVTTTQNVVGNFFFPYDVTAGQLIVYGNNNTRLRITVTVPNTASVELDNGNGTFVPVATIYNLNYY